MPFAISHLTRYGSGNRSARKPKPGMTAVDAEVVRLVGQELDLQRRAGLRAAT